MFPRVQHSCIICLFEWTYEFLNTAQGKRLLAKEKDCLEPVAPVGKDLEGALPMQHSCIICLFECSTAALFNRPYFFNCFLQCSMAALDL